MAACWRLILELTLEPVRGSRSACWGSRRGRICAPGCGWDKSLASSPYLDAIFVRRGGRRLANIIVRKTWRASLRLAHPTLAGIASLASPQHLLSKHEDTRDTPRSKREPRDDAGGNCDSTEYTGAIIDGLFNQLVLGNQIPLVS